MQIDKESEGLKECPWCAAGTTTIYENKGVWGGTKGYGEPISVEVQHWCKKEEGQPSPRRLVFVGRDEKDAIRIWNTRALTAKQTVYLDRIQELKGQEAKLTAIVKELREALELCMIGGNHLAHILIKNLGAGFCDRYPFNAGHEEVLEKLGVGDNYDVWCCWSQIMKARDKQEQALLRAEQLEEIK